MHKLILSLAAASLLTAPAEAASQYDNMDSSMGTFAGARFQVSLGGRTAARPRASLAIAPTLSRTSGGMVVKTTIGEGIALNFGRKPTLTLAGIPADQALGLKPSKDTDPSHKNNLSTGGWIAVGVGVVAVGAGIYYVHLMHVAEENSD